MQRLAIALLLLGCGARSDVHPYDAGAPARPDAFAPTDAGRDAFVSPDAFTPPDAATIVCPDAPASGFAIESLGTIDLGRRAGDVWLGGDGRRVFLLASEREPFQTLHLYVLFGGAAQEVGSVEGFGRVAVANGVARVIALQGNDVVSLASDGGPATDVGRTTIFHGTRLAPERPVWNGARWVIGGSTGFVGALTAEMESTSWRPVDGALVRLDADTATGFTHVLHSALDLTLDSFDAAGVRVGGATLDSLAWSTSPAFGWLDDGTNQPIVLAGVTREGDDMRVRLQRFALDGTPRGGFSAPVDFGSGAVDLSTVAIAPHTSGYGMVASSYPSRTLFHGATESFVGDARDLPFVCAAPSIAAGPCGYVIACTIDGVVHGALAVPAPPH